MLMLASVSNSIDTGTLFNSIETIASSGSASWILKTVNSFSRPSSDSTLWTVSGLFVGFGCALLSFGYLCWCLLFACFYDVSLMFTKITIFISEAACLLFVRVSTTSKTDFAVLRLWFSDVTFACMWACLEGVNLFNRSIGNRLRAFPRIPLFEQFQWLFSSLFWVFYLLKYIQGDLLVLHLKMPWIRSSLSFSSKRPQTLPHFLVLSFLFYESETAQLSPRVSDHSELVMSLPAPLYFIWVGFSGCKRSWNKL